MDIQNILFIGGGNMTRAIVSGLISDNYPAEKLMVIDRNADKRTFFLEKYGITAEEKLTRELILRNVIVLSVKPQAAKEVCLQLQLLLQQQKPLILSVMAGITIDALHTWLNKKTSIVRAMPNTPALIKMGATGLFADESVSEKQKQHIEFLMSSVGITAWLDKENQIDAITSLSGSGPAYFFYLMEAMQNAGVELGLPEKIAKQFSIQTALGAAMLAQNSNESISTLRAQVTSKGGTTEAALSVLQKNNFLTTVNEAMIAAKNRAEELGGQ